MLTLVPRSADAAWTRLGKGKFNARPQPGGGESSSAAAAAANSPAAQAAAAAAEAFPSGPNWVGGADWLNPVVAQQVDIGNITSAVLGLNPKRVGLIIQNNSAAGGPNLYVSFGQVAVAGKGLKVAPNGGAVLMDFACPRNPVYVTVDAAGMIGTIIELSNVPLPPQTQMPQGGQDIGIVAWGIGGGGAG